MLDGPFGFPTSQRLVRLSLPFDKYHEEAQPIYDPKNGFQVSMSVAHFKPDEITVKVVENCILVEAKHEERLEDGNSYVSRQFNRRYVLPDEYNIADVVSKLSSDGILTVIAPPKHLDAATARTIDILHTGAPAAEKAKGSHKGDSCSQEKVPKAE